MAATLSFAVHGQQSQFKLEVVDRQTDLSQTPLPQCKLPRFLEAKQVIGVVDRGERGAYVVVTGSPDPAFDGLYRITAFRFERDRDRAVINTTFRADCIVTPLTQNVPTIAKTK